MTQEKKYEITQEILFHLGGKFDGAKRNIIAQCPFCGKPDKFGVYVGREGSGKVFGASNCFRCNRGYKNLKGTLEALGLDDLLPKETATLDDEPSEVEVFEDEIDVDLVEIEMPKGYKRCFKNAYLKSRGWNVDDYEYFPVGTNRGIDREFENYVILEVLDEGKKVGYVARSTFSKDELERMNARRHFKIQRYKNSNETNGNGFGRLLYNYDAIVPMETHSVILCEGPFDVVGLNRKLELYDNKAIVPVATFGKKISREQMFKLQKKGVEQVVIGYDNDAKETISQVGSELEQYFDVLVADIPDGIGKDWDEMPVEDIYDVFCNHLKTIREFNLG